MNLFSELLAEPDGDVSRHTFGVRVRDVVEGLLQHQRVLVHRRVRLRVLRLAGVSHHLHLSVAHCCHQQLAYLEHHVIRRSATEK